MLSSRIIFIFETEGVINDFMILGNHYSTLALGRSGSKGFRVPGGFGAGGRGGRWFCLFEHGRTKAREKDIVRKSRGQAEEVENLTKR